MRSRSTVTEDEKIHLNIWNQYCSLPNRWSQVSPHYIMTYDSYGILQVLSEKIVVQHAMYIHRKGSITDHYYYH